MKFGLQSKLLVPTVTAVVLCMGLASCFIFSKASDELWNGLVKSSSNITNSVSKGLAIYAKDILSVSKTQSRALQIVAMYDSPDMSEETRLTGIKALSELTKFDDSIQAANLFDTKGNMYLSTDSLPGTTKPK